LRNNPNWKELSLSTSHDFTLRYLVERLDGGAGLSACEVFSPEQPCVD